MNINELHSRSGLSLLLEKAAHMALEALEFYCVRSEDGEDLTPEKTKKAITDLRVALEQPTEKEPCGWRKKHNGEWVYAFSNDAWEFIRKGQPEQQEPVARVVGYYAGRCVIEPLGPAAVMPNNMALYTRPQAREPLTPAEINQIEARWDAYMHGSKIAFVVRQTEAAHGIHALTERGEKK